MAEEGCIKAELPTVLFSFQEILYWELDRTYLFQVLANAAYSKLEKENPEAFAKLTNTWWGDVAPTDKGYQVTLHPSELD
jgi:hypothetical protein